jgi:hypothetical protein
MCACESVNLSGESSRTHKRLFVIGTPMPRLCNHHQIHLSLLHPRLGEIVKSPIDNPDLPALQSVLGNLGERFLPLASHPRRGLYADELGDVPFGIRG